MGIEIHDDQHGAFAGRIDFRIGDELFVVDRHEAQSVVALQRRVLAPSRVETCDEVGKAVGPREVPVTQLVLFRIEVFLRAGLTRLVLQELVGRSVEAVVRGQRRGEHEARHERGAAADLQVLGQDVGRVGPAVRAEIVAAPARVRAP